MIDHMVIFDIYFRECSKNWSVDMAKVPLFKPYLWEQIFSADTFLKRKTKK